jgi:hypothetical protein
VWLVRLQQTSVHVSLIDANGKGPLPLKIGVSPRGVNSELEIKLQHPGINIFFHVPLEYFFILLFNDFCQ